MWLFEAFSVWWFGAGLLLSALLWLVVRVMFTSYIDLVALLLVTTALLFGAKLNHDTWAAKVAEAKTTQAVIETKGEGISTETGTRVEIKREIVRLRGETVIKYIDREVVVHDNTCVIPTEFIFAHNEAAK